MKLASDKPTLPKLDPKTGYLTATFDHYPHAFCRNLNLLCDKLNLVVASVRYGTRINYARLLRELFTLSIVDCHKGIAELFCF